MFGLSSQETDYQREVVERLHLPFPLLSDPARSLAQELGLPTFEAGGLTFYKRLILDHPRRRDRARLLSGLPSE